MRTRTMSWKVANGFFGLLFVFAAVLQINDEDPLRWITVYLAAAVPCFLEWTRHSRWWLPVIVASVAILWALKHAGHGAWSVPLLDMFDEWEMKDERVRDTREVFGLLIVTGWMLAIAAVQFVRTRRARHSEPPFSSRE